MKNRGKGRFQQWLERRDRSNQAAMDATRPPPVPDRPAVVLHARTPIPDSAFAYRLRLLVDGKLVDGVPWGWSVHPLPLGTHTLELFHLSGPFPKASRAKVDVTLGDTHPVMQVVYSATVIGLRKASIAVVPYQRQGEAKSGDPGGVSPDADSL